MGFTETLRLVLDADMQGGVRNVENFGNKAEREFSKSEKTLDKWGNRLTSAGTGMVAFGAAALFGLGKMAMASEEAELSVVKLENTISNMPKLAGETSSQFIDLAESIQDVTAADADAIVEGQALLGTFNLTAQEIKGITPLVVDYARKFGTDIPTAAVQVGKALDGSVGALKKNGVSIDETLFKTDRYRAVQEALANQVGGFAEAEGKTFAGSLERLKNQLGDIAEGVGSGAVDAFTSMFGAVDMVSDKLNQLSPEAQNTIGKLATYGSVALIAAGGTSVLIGQVVKARENFGTAWSAVGGLTERLGGLKTAAILGGAAIGVLVTGFALWSDESAENRAEQERLRESLRQTEGSIKGVTRELVIDAFRPWIDGLNDAGVSVNDLTDALDGNKDAVEKVKRASFEMGASNGRGLRLQLEAGTKAIKDQRDALKEESEFTGEATGATDELTQATGEAAGSIDDMAESTEDAKTALQEWADAQRAMFDPLFKFNDALIENEQAQGRVAAAELGLIAAEQELAKAQREHGRSSDEAAEASMNLMGAQTDLEDANRDVISSAVDYESAFADLKAGIEAGTVKISEAKGTIDRWAASGRVSAGSAAFFKGEIDKLTGAIRNVPNQKATSLTVNAAQAREQLSAVRSAINNVPAYKRVDIDVAVRTKGGVSVGGGSFKIFHTGGVVPGQRGQEVAAILLGQEEVLEYDDPRHSSNLGVPAMARSGLGGGQVVQYHYHLNIAGSVLSERDLIRIVRDEHQRGGFRGLVR